MCNETLHARAEESVLQVHRSDCAHRSSDRRAEVFVPLRSKKLVGNTHSHNHSRNRSSRSDLQVQEESEILGGAS